MIRLLALVCTMFLLAGCNKVEEIDAEFGTCVSCHAVHNDTNHRMRCITCHRGDDSIATKLESHSRLIAHPAHPDQMVDSCASCHEKEVRMIEDASHFTLANLTNTFRRAFGALETLDSFTQTPGSPKPETALELADDLLRRRCYKCHLFDSGEKYPSTGHGQGCAACHLPYYEGKLQSHVFAAPEDRQCLSCHYGNYVGFDYYGRFEHDFNVEYRTPYTTSEDYFRPYGIEYRQLSSDIHQRKGLLCIDCHGGRELMYGGAKPSCAGCHDTNRLKENLPPRVEPAGGSYVFTSQSGRIHTIPVLSHPAHQRYGDTVSCQACHALWSFKDSGTDFLRMDTDEIDSFSALTVQGSYEIERLLENNLDFDREERPLAMTDTLTGEKSPGIWLKGYLTRRWEDIPLGRNEQGRIAVVRPTLDYHLSWIDEDDEVRFDSIAANAEEKRQSSYTPHTTGAAGLFYQQKIQDFLRLERQQQESGSPPQNSKE